MFKLGIKDVSTLNEQRETNPFHIKALVGNSKYKTERFGKIRNI